ncbi:unnamed protein product, partial [Porites lobata]
VTDSPRNDDFREKARKWTFLAASMPVIFGCLIIFFQTQTSLSKQSTYAPVIVMGSGVSIMYVMALTLATELTGKYKVHACKLLPY